ncbi:galactoside alpha-(1,2)-fucosyltransferase 2-like [Haliotis rufescens]|uniref:galactoside alpha-(1,2)-fucosyltransferase 2-like n=1 Tax=Haliotis rufescens TaxID=6454 RepID=UPI00201F62AB|nr:galactoside alpha-(1,2)-fucosyltransferase 2-like [Haliotis rufescens]
MAIWRKYGISTAKKAWLFVAIYTIIVLTVFLTIPTDNYLYFALGGKQTLQGIKNDSTGVSTENVTKADKFLALGRDSSLTMGDATTPYSSGTSSVTATTIAAAASTLTPGTYSGGASNVTATAAVAAAATLTANPYSGGTSESPEPKCKGPDRDLIHNNNMFLCCMPLGGLGNHMFVYASCYGFAAYYNRTLAFPKSSMLTKYFKLKAHLIQDYCACDSATFHLEKINCGEDSKLWNLSTKGNIKIGYYLQSWKYFGNVIEDIRRQFTFSETTLAKARDIISKLASEHQQRTKRLYRVKPVLVGIHVRRGDIDSEERLVKFGYELATPAFFSHAMEYFRKKYVNVLFVVCSLEMRWTKWYVAGDDIIYVEGNDFVMDLAVLISCDHTLTSVGTYSWWAGFMSRGETVYYKWPAREGSSLRKQFSANYTDYFLPEWVGLK